MHRGRLHLGGGSAFMAKTNVGENMIRFMQRPGAEITEDLRQTGLPDTLLRLLAARGIVEKEAALAFLSPELSQLHDPMLLSGMHSAVETIEGVLARGGQIVVYGDYDVDGMCATAILLTYLQKRGANATSYIPSRHEEGYGLNEAAVRSLAGRCDLLITVDCGITSAVEVAIAKALGMQVIITDHHQLGEVMPACEAVINPLLAGYPFAKLCGAGVAWKLVWALGGQAAALPLIDLAALATVADLVPLLGENRVIVKEGLEAISRGERPGMSALIEVAGLTGRDLSAGHLGFQLGPRLNAAGRIQDANLGVSLLMQRKHDKARAIALELDANNTRRRELESRMLEEAVGMVSREVDFLRHRCIVLCGEGWNEGVIGLVASRLVERYGWPVVMLARQGERCTGSARSIPGINIHTALFQCRELFDRFGGHAAAAGLSMPADRVEALRQRLSEAVREQEESDTFLPSLRYDLELPLAEVDEALITQLEKLAPTGIENPAPVLLTRGVVPVGPQCIGKEKNHLKMQLTQEGSTREAIGFRMGEQIRDLPGMLDVLYVPGLNTWMDKTRVQMELKALTPTAPAKAFRDLCLEKEQTFLRAICAQIIYNSTITDEADEESGQESLDTESLDKALGAELASGRQGVLMLVSTLPALRKWIVRLNVMGLPLAYAVGRVTDLRMYNTLLAAPEAPLQVAGQPRVIALLDGVFAPGQLSKLRKAYPNARLLVASDAQGAREQALSQLVPGEEELRALYRQMRSLSQGTLAQLAAAIGFCEAKALAALEVLGELGLAALDEDKRQWSLLPPRKCDLNDSAFLRALRAAQR